MADQKHHRASSSLSDFTLLELEHTPSRRPRVDSISLHEIHTTQGEQPEIPASTLVIVAETEKLEEKPTESSTLLASLSDLDLHFAPRFKVKDWDGSKFYSDYIRDGLEYLNKAQDLDVVMLFESPSSSTADSSFHNKAKFKFHDWPPPKSTKSKATLGPCRYAAMNGTSYPVYLRDGIPPPGLVQHWQNAIPHVKPPTFCASVPTTHTVYAYLPVEQIEHHVNDPMVHYHLAGKDAIHLMTQKTTKLLPDTRTSRPCVVKTTHSMGSKGIFIIRNDEDEAEFEQFLEESGNPTFVVTDFVDIHRNVACHFFLHPSGDIVWFGSNENVRDSEGKFSSDSYLMWEDQESLKKMQLPFVEEVAQYCKSLGFWGFCGVDVLFDSQGLGYLVDINPRVTGSCPALMALKLLHKEYGFQVGLFRRSGPISFPARPEELVQQVDAYNAQHEGKSRVVLHSFYENKPGHSRVNVGVYGNDLEECKEVLDRFARPTVKEA